MLKKNRRLTTAEFDRYFSKGRRYHSPNLTLVYTYTGNFHGSVVVGKKVYKKAVDRNKLRRQLYQIIYRWQKSGNPKGVYIVLTKPTVRGVDFATLRLEAKKLFNSVAAKS